MRKNNYGKVYEIRDLISDEAVIPQFCSHTEENAKRQFAIFLSQNKFKTCDFELNEIGYYESDKLKTICRGSEVLVTEYVREPLVEEE